MKTDALGRRKRTAPQPTGKDPKLNQGVLDLLEGLRRYHPLPPRLAFRLWKVGDYYPYFQDKLKDLTHEQPDGEEPVIVRPEYFNPEGILNSEPVWYDLSPRGLRIARALAAAPLEIPERDHMKHRAFNACVGASLEILAPQYGLRSIHFEEIIAHRDCPDTTRKLRNPLRMQMGSKHIEADRIHGLEHDKGFRFYAIEIDRATESNVRTVYEKLDNWLKVLEDKLFNHVYGLPNLRIMFVTTAPGRIATYLDYLKGKPKAHLFLFKSLSNFGVHWRAPREPIAELFLPWETVAGPFDITKA